MSLRDKVALVLLAAVMLWFVSLDSRADLSQEQANSIWMQAYNSYGVAVGGLPLPGAPKIYLLSRAALYREYEILNGSVCHTCDLRGWQYEGAVYIRDDLDFSTVRDASTLFHEFIHYLQYVHLGPYISCNEADKECRAAACAQWLERERQAFMLQAQVVSRAGGDVRQIYAAMRNYRC